MPRRRILSHRPTFRWRLLTLVRNACRDPASTGNISLNPPPPPLPPNTYLNIITNIYLYCNNRNDRFVATLRLRDIEAGCTPARRELPIAQRQPEPLSRRVLFIFNFVICTLNTHIISLLYVFVSFRRTDRSLSLPSQLCQISRKQSIPKCPVLVMLVVEHQVY